MKTNLRRSTYFYENYEFQNINNYYIIKGVGPLNYKNITESLEELMSDVYLLGKSLLLEIENVSNFSRFIGKAKKRYKIRLLPFYNESDEKQSDTDEKKSDTDEIMPVIDIMMSDIDKMKLDIDKIMSNIDERKSDFDEIKSKIIKIKSKIDDMKSNIGKMKKDFIKDEDIDINLEPVIFGNDLMPNENGVIEITDYLELMSNHNIQTLLLDFCKKHGLPYHENVEWPIIQESLSSNVPMSINIKDLVLTSITIYLLSELKKYLSKEIIPSAICKIMSISNSSTKQDLNDRFNMYINAFYDTYVNVLSKYGDYTTPILFESGTNNMCIKTCNLVQAVSFYFNTYILLGNFNICCRCFAPTINYRKRLCDECYNDNPDYGRDKERRELNAIAKEVISKLKLLNSKDINAKISEINYDVKNPKEDKIYALMDLWNTQNIN